MRNLIRGLLALLLISISTPCLAEDSLAFDGSLDSRQCVESGSLELVLGKAPDGSPAVFHALFLQRGDVHLSLTARGTALRKLLLRLHGPKPHKFLVSGVEYSLDGPAGFLPQQLPLGSPLLLKSAKDATLQVTPMGCATPAAMQDDEGPSTIQLRIDGKTRKLILTETGAQREHGNLKFSGTLSLDKDGQFSMARKVPGGRALVRSKQICIQRESAGKDTSEMVGELELRISG